jgi:uncharacterized protein (TIGR03435 family)
VLIAASLPSGREPAPTPGDATLSFEAASVKVSKTFDGVAMRFSVEPNRIDIQHMDLKFLIMQAYDLRDDQVTGPDSLFDRAYDIAATTSAPVSRATMRILLRNLLMERFHLTTHWQTRTSAIYRLVALPQGPKMKMSDPTVDKRAM